MQAVVSQRPAVRAADVVPFFSQIGDVREFTFTGSTTTNSGTTVHDPDERRQT